MSRIQLRVQDLLHQQIEEQATRSGLTLSEYVLGAVFERLQRDREAASRIQLSAQSRDWFFEVLDDASPLPQAWEQAAKTAAEIKG